MSLFHEITGPLYPLLDWPMNSGANGGYALCSGLGLGALGIGAWWRTHNCHVHHCWRISWHPHPEHGHPVCKRHHPHDPRNLTGDDSP